jgi:hypothetical protein
METLEKATVAKQPSRHITYHDLRDALAEPGCPLCRRVARAVDRYLRALLYESVNDPEVREGLRASQGFCRQHAWQVQRRASPLSIAILWRDLLSQELAPEPSANRRARLCPACAVAAEAERGHLAALAEHLEAGSLRDEFAASAGLCLPHLRAALRAAKAGAREFLLAAESEKIAALREQLSEIIRKHDYRFRGEPWGREKDAWIRATAKLAGEAPEE